MPNSSSAALIVDAAVERAVRLEAAGAAAATAAAAAAAAAGAGAAIDRWRRFNPFS